MSIINNFERVGNFTSSEIGNLTKQGKAKGTFGAPALTYIEETNMERRLGRSLTDESRARPLSWGKLLEAIAFDRLGLEYSLSSQESIVHPTIPYWSGSPDGTKPDTVIDIKCPLTLKSFCQLVQPLYDGMPGNQAIAAIRDNHKDGDKYYWQIVSNAILTNSKYGELVVYMPFESELPDIKNAADGVPDCMWIMFANENELPFIKDGGYYKNVNVIRFEIPESDKRLLTDSVIKAGETLIARNIEPTFYSDDSDSKPETAAIQSPSTKNILSI